ncbi:hypothetical protein CBS101457_006161 [Exobasidium rhododendri]|nr:hypothetical protein CBS101457_006161 [Exobasidium rhododendri]
MALVTSAQPLDVARHFPPSIQSPGSLERSTSSSSSATAHPLENSSGATILQEEKASSSTSSSSTIPSTASSSNHKTTSTTISPVSTYRSLSPTLANHFQKQPKRVRTTKRDTATQYPANNEYSWDSQDALRIPSSQSTKTSGRRSPSGQRLMDETHDNRWESSQYRDEDDPYSPIVDEETSTQYPPVSEEDKEARAIKQNLERWAIEERQRRKALRTSRTGSMISPSTGTNRMSKRLSAFSILGPGKGTLEEQGTSIERHSTLLQRREGSTESGASWDSESKTQSSGSMDSLSERTIDGDGEARRAAKGKGRDASNPFQDPSSKEASTETSFQQRQSPKPTPRKPIVTPGKAATIRHRAIENARKTGGSGRMPSIVATDADEDAEAIRHLQNLVIDPFQSEAEAREHDGYTSAKKQTLLEGDRSDTDAASAGLPPLRQSFSSSKFNEIGLDDDVNSLYGASSHNPDPAGRASRVESPQNDQVRKTWWSEWLCGCGNVDEEEGEQSGRTCPEF